MSSAAIRIPGIPDRFRIMHELGHGGMARVYLAHDQVTNTRVALKVLLDHLRTDEMVAERFRREIAAVRRVSHPNVVSIFELIENDAVMCLVQEYHDGIELKRWIRRRERLDAESVVNIALQVLDALDAAHRQGIIHRDIKPHNILVDQNLRAKVVGFGLARVDDMAGLTTHTMAVGTPEYMSPELMISQIIDGRADLYALGVTMFEALTGELPYSAATPLALMKMHHDAEPPPLSDKSPELPAWLVEVVLRAMQTEPEDRFSTAAEMRSAIHERRVVSSEHDADLCSNCGAELVPGLTVCVECGHEVVQIRESKDTGASVALVGKKFVFAEEDQDFLTYQEKNALMNVLHAMGATQAHSVKRTDRMLRLFPLSVATNLSSDDARYLAAQIQAVGVPVRVYPDTLGGLFRKFWDFQEPMLWLKRGFVLMMVMGWAVGLAVAKFGPWAILPFGIALLFWWLARFFHRLSPIMTFTGEKGYALSNDALALRATRVFEVIQSPRIRRILHRILSRGIRLRERVESSEWAPEGMVDEIDMLLMSALDVAERSGLLDDQTTAFDVRRAHERIQALDERLHDAQDRMAAASIIEEKVHLTGVLQDNDARQDEVARLSSQLLAICSELESLDLNLQDVNTQTADSVSMILRGLNSNIDAITEIELGLYDVDSAAAAAPVGAKHR